MVDLNQVTDFFYDAEIRLIAAQIVGFVALAGALVTYSQRDDQTLKKWSIAQSVVLAIHFLLLGTYVACGAAIVSGVRNYFSLRTDMKKLVPLFLATYAAFGYFKFQVWFDLLPMIGSMGSTIGLFYLRGISMRLTFLFSTSLWLTHNILAGSIGPAIMELFILLATLRTIWHLRQNKKLNAATNAAPH